MTMRGFLKAALEVGGDEVAQVVVVLRVLREQDAEAVADRDARGDDRGSGW